MLARLVEYDDLNQETYTPSAREIVQETITDPLLAEMLFCPVMWYGNAREHDMDFGQFSIIFRSIFLEGLARPFRGVRLILKNLVRRFRGLGGDLKLRAGVDCIKTEGNRAVSVVLDDGSELQARRIVSSAGRMETLRLCDDLTQVDEKQMGQLSFVETISILDVPPKVAGYDNTLVFFNDNEKLHWQKPSEELCDVRTGVVCSPNNFRYENSSNEPADAAIRITSLASFDRWSGLPEDEYRLAKLGWYDRIVNSATRFIPDFRGHVIDTDVYTPKTIRRFTWKENGAVYGAPEKKLDGTTHLDNLFLCGTDQGFVGIIGSIFSGISIANKHCLRD